jgi:hypothetical protein
LAAMPPSVVRPSSLITGDDLIAAGYKPGPKFKHILSAIEDGQLEGRLCNKQQALEFVVKEFPLD